MQNDLASLTTYVRGNLARGYSREQIRQALAGVGWGDEDIKNTFADLDKTSVLPSGAQATSIRSNIAFRMWAVPIAIAAVLFVIFNIYAYFWQSEFSLFTLSVAVAGAAAFCIGFSFALSGISYYFNFLDHEIAYRKNLGLVGYFLALTYSILLLFVHPEIYFYGFFDNLTSADFILGLTAMGILSLMALVSNNFVMRKIGARTWRFILRLGYVAYFLLIVRGVVMEGDEWFLWLQRIDNLPPPRLIVTIFAIGVIALRVSMEISLRRKK